MENTTIVDPDPKAHIQNHKIWKKNAPRLYDFFLSSALLWPSMTVQWFPDKEIRSHSHSIQRLLLGTRTSYQMDECVRIVHATLPAQVAPELPNISQWNESLQEIGGYTSAKDYGTKVMQKIFHTGEVNKARYMPQNPDIIASFSSDKNVYIYDRTRHPLEPPVLGDPPSPDVVLSHHTAEGFGLSWNPNDKGKLLSAAGLELVLWDLTRFDKSSKTLSPHTLFSCESLVVNDVEWSPFDSCVFASATDQGRICMHDLRSQPGPAPVSFACSPANDDASSLAFNRENSNLLATSLSNGCISLWDLRNTAQCLFSLHKHSDSVVRLEWSPHSPAVLASASADTTVMIWDVAAHSSSVEPLFVHAGHTSEVSDISWNPAVPWQMASVADNNELHIWTPARSLVV